MSWFTPGIYSACYMFWALDPLLNHKCWLTCTHNVYLLHDTCRLQPAGYTCTYIKGQAYTCAILYKTVTVLHMHWIIQTWKSNFIVVRRNKLNCKFSSAVFVTLKWTDYSSNYQDKNTNSSCRRRVASISCTAVNTCTPYSVIRRQTAFRTSSCHIAVGCG